MTANKKTFKRQFGEIIPNLSLHGEPANYPVLNERDVRAGAGIMFLFGMISFTNALLLQNYSFLSVFIIVFAAEFAIRIFINPNYAPIYAIAKLLVKKQKPEYSGAIQKKFAWSLGLILATAMIIIVPVLQIRGTLPFTLCLICLALLWLETALGICVGCTIYNTLLKYNIIPKPNIKPACPGGSCAIPQKK